MQLAENLRNKFVSKAVRNVQRGYMDDDKSRGLFRPEVKLDLQRSRLMTESFKETDGQAMVLRRAKALAHVLDNMGIFIREWERIVGYKLLCDVRTAMCAKRKSQIASRYVEKNKSNFVGNIPLHFSTLNPFYSLRRGEL